MIAVIIVAAVLVLLAIATGLIGILVARALVSPVVKSAEVSVRRLEDELVELSTTDGTRLDGVFGLTYEQGHARIGEVLVVGDDRLIRRVDSELGEPIPAPGSGSWRRDVFRDPSEAGLEFVDVTVPTEAGDAPAWIVQPKHVSGSRVWAIHLHGIRTTRSVVIPSVIAAAEAGVTSLVPSWRNDGDGPWTRRRGSTLGASEARDVEAAIRFAIGSGAESVVLVGWSMGAWIALRLLEDGAIRQLVAGVVLVAPMTDWRPVLERAVRQARLPGFISGAAALALRVPALVGVIGISERVDIARTAATPSNVPALVIHNPDDQLVPFEVTRRFADRWSGEIDFEEFGACPHAMEWNTDRGRFESVVTAWLSRRVSPGASGRGRMGAGSDSGSGSL